MYEKTEWVDHVVERVNTYSLTPNEDGSYQIEPEPGEIIQQGTPIKAEYLNHIEDGIEELDTGKLDADGGTANQLSVTGGMSVTGGISANGSKVTEVGTPTTGTDAANKQYVDDQHFFRNVTISTVWNGSEPPYTQTVAVEGVLETDNPHVMPVYSDNIATADAQQEAWSMIDRGKPGNGTITFRAKADKPTTNIPLIVEVNR